MTDNEPTTGGEPATDGGTVDPTESLPAGETDDSHEFPSMGEVKRWFVTTNHKDVGILYLITGFFFFLFGGVLALLMRLQLWAPRAAQEGVLSAMAYNQAVSAHGLLMVFWFISPFAFGFANYFVPLQIGAKDLSFPRLNALSYWLYLASGLLFGVSFFQGGTFSGGWTMYAPLNLPTYTPQIGATTVVLSLILFSTSVTLGSVNFITTIHRMRAEGLRLRDLPLFSSSILLTVWMMLFAFAALLAALMVLSSDHILGTTYYAAGAGEASHAGGILWTHLFWFFGHPEVYIVFFPALGIMAEVFQTFTGNRIVGRKWFIASMALVAVQSFIVWMHHMFLTSINLQIKTLFMATTIGISLPFDLMVFALIYTLLKGRIRFTTPFLFSFGALLLFIIGGITGVFLGAVILDYEFRGTYWVVAHFHYVMVGGATALFGGLYYWFPKITGKMYNEFLGKVHFGLYFIGFNLLYFPMFLAWETPRRVFDYNAAFEPWHKLSTIGAFILGASFLFMIYNFYVSLFSGEDAGENPWAYSTTAEWAIPSPPPLENFPGIPSYSGGSLSFRDESAVTDGGVAAGASATGHEAGHEEEHADHASYWPFLVAVGLFTTMLGVSGVNPDPETLTVDPLYGAITAVGGVTLLGSFIGMARESFHAPEPAIAERWPFEGVENTKLGMWVFLASDVVLFGAFIGSYLFTRVAYGWQEWHDVLIPEAHVTLPGLLNTYILLTSSFAVVLSLVAARKKSRAGVLAGLITTLVLGIGFLANKGIEWIHLFNLHGGEFAGGWGLSTNIASSTFYLTTGLHGAHVIIGLVITMWLIVRTWNGAYMGEEESRPIEYFGLYWHFVDIVWLFLFPLFYIV
jgi:cytochrome c oxidase subunit I+III